MSWEGTIEPHREEAKVCESLVAGEGEGELFLEEIQFDQEDGEALFVDEKED